jgi:drug/metabolite transporter (DMT)-like permease
LAVVGVAFLELGGDMSASSMTAGDMLSMVQPFAFGIGFWRMEQAMQRYPKEAPRLTAAQLLAVFLASAGYGLWAIDLPTLQSYPWAEWLTSTPILLSLFWTGCITTALTIYMENVAMETLSAAETTLIFSTEPRWGTAFAAAVMGEQLGFNAAVGAFCILTACVYSSLGWQGLNSLLKGMTVKGTRKSMSVRELPAAFQNQWTWFSSSVATSLASWSVAAKISRIEEFDDTIEELITDIIEKLP